jgi:hypothetical protein
MPSGVNKDYQQQANRTAVGPVSATGNVIRWSVVFAKHPAGTIPATRDAMHLGGCFGPKSETANA